MARACSFTATLAGLSTQILLAVCVQYYTKAFGDDRWAIHYYARIQDHELISRRDLIPSGPDHPRAGRWYYALQLGPLEHKLPLIVSTRWRRVTFIVTSGDRFMNAAEINDLFDQESPVGQLYVRLKELGIAVERVWWINEEGTAYVVDLALPTRDGWLPVTFGDRPGLAEGLRFATEAELDACLQEVQARLRAPLSLVGSKMGDLKEQDTRR